MSIRSDLPSLEGVAYLNAGTNGPLPRPAAEAMRRELDTSLAEPRIGMAAFPLPAHLAHSLRCPNLPAPAAQ